MSLPTAREVYGKNGTPHETMFDTMEDYIYYLEQQHKEMLDALIKTLTEICKECCDCFTMDMVDCDFKGCYLVESAVLTIKSATGLSIDEAIKRYNNETP